MFILLRAFALCNTKDSLTCAVDCFTVSIDGTLRAAIKAIREHVGGTCNTLTVSRSLLSLCHSVALSHYIYIYMCVYICTSRTINALQPGSDEASVLTCAECKCGACDWHRGLGGRQCQRARPASAHSQPRHLPSDLPARAAVPLGWSCNSSSPIVTFTSFADALKSYGRDPRVPRLLLQYLTGYCRP